MKRSTVTRLGSTIVAALALGGAAQAQPRTKPAPPVARKDSTMRASGTFEVVVKPLPFHTTTDASLGRMSLDKTLHGDLEATGQGEMLTAATDVKSSAGYVAIERVTGTLRGRAGSFAMQHLGTMNRGAQSLTITIVPDSGTGQLTGIAGTFTIHIVDGKHSYDLDYTLPDAP